MTEKVADYIINSRPFTDYQDLVCKNSLWMIQQIFFLVFLPKLWC